ncbi:MAG: DUF6056 family protein [Ruminococcus sp.]|nr:DUF6056 family protein [Ruminococcus sp.]
MSEKKQKIAAIASILFFLLLLMPILYLSFVNRATGDDYGYGVYTRAAWIHTHSLIEVFKAACRTIREFYYSLQGTWFSIFLFSLQPEVFHDRAYVIVAFIMLFVWIGSTFYLFRQVLCNLIGMDKYNCCLASVLILLAGIEFIPSTRSSIYWFNGCAHYMIPFSMCLMVTAWLFQYGKSYHGKYLAGITLFMALLGGSNYQPALFALIVTCYTLFYILVLKRDKRILTLLLPVFLEMAGLIVSMTAPGNNVRVAIYAYEEGAEFGFSLTKVFKTIGSSFIYALKDILVYLQEKPLIFPGLFLLLLIFIAAFCLQKEIYHFEHPLWIAAMLFCLYAAMQAPAIYAGVPVSGGVPNTNFLVFLLTAAGFLLLIAEKAARLLKKLWADETAAKVFRLLIVPGILVCLLLTFFLRSNIKSSTSYVALRYITSGEATDYKQQMDLQTRLLTDPDAEDVVVPGINDVQGPLMHMPITDDPRSFTSWAAAGFYEKNSVYAIDRNEWLRLYGDETD